jgi:hypothetical protein
MKQNIFHELESWKKYHLILNKMTKKLIGIKINGQEKPYWTDKYDLTDGGFYKFKTKSKEGKEMTHLLAESAVIEVLEQDVEDEEKEEE